jgi:hypothetical protein
MHTEQYQIYMFHFRCPVCAASPGRRLLRDYLQEWGNCPPDRLYSLLCNLLGALDEVENGGSRWLTKKFGKAAQRLRQAIDALAFDPPLKPDSLLIQPSSGVLHFNGKCPMCGSDKGARKPDNYFTTWSQACKVQTGNLLYESGLILWGVLLGLPSWAPGSFLRQLNLVRSELRRTGKEMSLLECPQCGRLTTGLYGTSAGENRGFCRWCLDMGGGLGLTFRVSLDSDGQPSVSMETTDHGAPAKNAWDVLPPDILKRVEIEPDNRC